MVKVKSTGIVRISAKDLGALSLPEFCPRCLWFKLRMDKRLPFQLPMPGIFSSLDSYSKRVIHAYFDRNGRLPEYLAVLGDDFARYADGRQLHYSRYQCLDAETGVLLTGSPDEIFSQRDGHHHILDYKTAKFTDTQDELFPMYDVQLNGYAFIAEQSGLFRPVSRLTLVYMQPVTEIAAAADPENWDELGFRMGFMAKLLKVDLNPGKIPPLLKKLRSIYDLDVSPTRKLGCANCSLLDQLLRTAAA